MRKQFMNTVICASAVSILLSGQAFSATSIKGLNESGIKEGIFVEGAGVEFDKHKMEGLEEGRRFESLDKKKKEGLVLEGAEGNLNQRRIEGFEGRPDYSSKFNKRSFLSHVREGRREGNDSKLEGLDSRILEGNEIFVEGLDSKLEGLDSRILEGNEILEGNAGKLEGKGIKEGIFVEGQDSKKEGRGLEGLEGNEIMHEGRFGGGASEGFLEGNEIVLEGQDSKKEGRGLEGLEGNDGKLEGNEIMHEGQDRRIEGQEIFNEGLISKDTLESTSEGLAALKPEITEAEAEAIALEFAGVDAKAAESLEMRIDADGDELIYLADFYSDGIWYFIDVDAMTGDIIAAGRSVEREQNPDGDSKEASKVTANEAMAIALKFVGLKDSDIDSITVETDIDNGYRMRNVYIYAGDTGYYVNVDAKTGGVYTAGWTQLPQEDAEEVSEISGLTEADAAEIALWYYELDEADVDAIYAEATEYDGYPVYDVEILCDDVVCMCDVDMETGEVVAAGWAWMRPSADDYAATAEDHAAAAEVNGKKIIKPGRRVNF